MKNNFPILYITYDGLLDPLGSSQIIPYIYGISKHTSPIHILSFEKLERFSEGKNNLKFEFISRGIIWHPLIFSKNKGYFGSIKKAWDFLRMFVFALLISIKHEIKIVHARSHVASWVALFLKRNLNVKFVFDCRGLWVDERVDKGGWDMNRLIPRLQYNYFKKRERSLFKNADYIVVLTEAVVNELIKLGTTQKDKISVIPCCADFNHFKFPSTKQKINTRILLGFQEHGIIIGYLGSIGKMYMIDAFLEFFNFLAIKRKDVFALIVTQDVKEAKDLVDLLIPSNLNERIKILSGTRDEIPQLLAAVDILVSFIKPSYARIACSPTKNAEALALGIPLICNYGIGDVDKQVNLMDAGYVVDLDNDYNFEILLDKIDNLKILDREKIRNAAYPFLDVHVANERYEKIYQKIKNDIFKGILN
jgi:glycosyltransferase involved in cell wall biosynthesis